MVYEYEKYENETYYFEQDMSQQGIDQIYQANPQIYGTLHQRKFWLSQNYQQWAIDSGKVRKVYNTSSYASERNSRGQYSNVYSTINQTAIQNWFFSWFVTGFMKY